MSPPGRGGVAALDGQVAGTEPAADESVRSPDPVAGTAEVTVGSEATAVEVAVAGVVAAGFAGAAGPRVGSPVPVPIADGGLGLDRSPILGGRLVGDRLKPGSGRVAGEEPVEQHAERVHVGSRFDRVAFCASSADGRARNGGQAAR